MSWWDYVVATSGTDSPKAMQRHTGIDGPNFSRWKGGHVPKADLVATFARGYGRPVLEAFVAAGFLTTEEADEQPAAAPSLSSLSDDELLAEVKARMEGARGEAQEPGAQAGGSQQPQPPAIDGAESVTSPEGDSDPGPSDKPMTASEATQALARAKGRHLNRYRGRTGDQEADQARNSR